MEHIDLPDLANYFAEKTIVMAGSGFGGTGPDDVSIACLDLLRRFNARVAIVQPTLDKAQEVVTKAGREGDDGVLTFAAGDDNWSEFDAIADALGTSWGSVDHLFTHYFHTAGGGIENTTTAQFLEVVNRNLISVFAVTQQLLPLIKAGRGRAIVHAGSIDGFFGNANVSAYSATKAGVHVLIHTLAAELAASNIRVNGIARAGSNMMPLPENVWASLDSATPMAATANPVDYANPMLFLASPMSQFMTGQIITVDGGRTASTPGCAPGYSGFTSQS